MELEKQILGHETDFFRKEFCENLQNLDNRIHDEFIEFGKAGMVFSKSSIIEYLSNLESDRDIEIIDFGIRKIKDDLIMANYISNEKELSIHAIRTSVWVKEDTDWRLYFHQGTVTEADNIR